MKILYDIRVLGKGHYTLRSRTGIFRVVENVARGLAQSNECDLHLCASHSLENVNQAIDYLQEHQELRDLPFISLGFEKNLYKRLLGVIKRLNDKPKLALGFNPFRRPFKALRESSLYAHRLAKKRIRILDTKELSTIDLFHSPFHPFPKYTHLAKNTKRIITIYDLIPIMYPKFFESSGESAVKKIIDSLAPNDCTICISHSTKNDLCNYQKNIDPARVFVAHLAASELFYPCHDSKEIDAVKKKFRIPDMPYILSLNTLEPRKNIAHTIHCFVKLVQQEKINDLCLVIAGRNGWDYDNILDEVSNAPSLKERVIITGYVADKNLAALYSGAIAFVFPSFYEGFGLPPLEAMQCGVPVITSNTSSLPEVVGDAGIMVAPTDTDALCQSMLEIYRKPSLQKAMSQKSIEQAKKFSWQKCTQETIRSYKTALSFN